MISIINKTGRKVAVRLAQRAIRAALGRVRGAVTVLFLTNKEMNTDVLSFPTGPVHGFRLPPGTTKELGTIAVNADLLKGKADLAHHLIHGTLHLLGKHHETVTSHKKIIKLEDRLLRKLVNEPHPV